MDFKSHFKVLSIKIISGIAMSIVVVVTIEKKGLCCSSRNCCSSQNI